MHLFISRVVTAANGKKIPVHFPRKTRPNCGLRKLGNKIGTNPDDGHEWRNLNAGCGGGLGSGQWAAWAVYEGNAPVKCADVANSSLKAVHSTSARARTATGAALKQIPLCFTALRIDSLTDNVRGSDPYVSEEGQTWPFPSFDASGNSWAT